MPESTPSSPATTQKRHGRPFYPSLEAWRAEATRLFGESAAGWRFACPACGHVASCEDFKQLGADPGRAPMQCIGRVLNELGRGDEVYSGPTWKAPDEYDDEDVEGEWVGPERGYDGRPCNWSAGGLLGTLSLGTLVKLDSGETWCFDFAEAA